MPKSTEKSRVLRELLETVSDLKAHGLLSKPELARMNALCEEPPTYTPDKVVEIRTRPENQFSHE
jgi:putative transcriptional regulator